MTKQEEKSLVLKDICARLPYGIAIYRITDNSMHRFPYSDITENVYQFSHFLEYSGIDNIKPYLRPMSSMTEEEEREYNKTLGPLGDFMFEQEELFKPIQLYKNIPFELYEFLNSHHFDYRGLIEKGLALEYREDK